MAGSITDGLSSEVSVPLSAILCTVLEGMSRTGNVSTINQVLGCLHCTPKHRGTHSKGCLAVGHKSPGSLQTMAIKSENLRGICANLVTEHCSSTV